jgi:hypothetical protein
MGQATDRAPSAAWLAAAVIASVAVVASAPFTGQLRAWLRASFPDSFATMFAAFLVVVVAGALVAALARIHDRRAGRYAAIGAALVVGVVQGWLFSTGIPEVDSVERIHFVEYGAITLLFFLAWRPLGDVSVLVMPVLSGLVVGTVEEWFQWFIPNRVGEARDVLLNLSAIACGLLFSLGLFPPRPFQPGLRRGSAARIGLASGAALMVYAAFVGVVHLGHDVTLDGVGTFRSRYSAERLARHSLDRTARWKTEPPVTLVRLSAEDQYMDEGLWHVRRRNDAWADGDYVTARQENRILETFFAPVLDTPSYVSTAGHRWPAEQREDAERRARGADAAYVSDAEPYPLMTWPRAAFWLGMSSAAALLIVAGLGLEQRNRAP